MSSRRGTIALMGSGELTSTMVEVHKELLGTVGGAPRAVFLDTPAGFQLNAGDLAERAVRYFHDRVQHPMQIVSFKSKTACSAREAELACGALRQADYILIGPGSPTYAVSQWRDTPIPEIFIQRIEAGGCLVAASAAALTVGQFTLPVYEIYKVGQDLHWVEGLHLLAHFGFPLVVIPHWNNAEGGTHDTRFCYMGGPRFKYLESLLPAEVSILGLDEHTACLLDLETREARVKGIGRVTLRHKGQDLVFASGDRFPLEVLRGDSEDRRRLEPRRVMAEPAETSAAADSSFWSQVQAAEAAFDIGAENRSPRDLVNSLLDFDAVLWQGQQDLENPEFIAQGRERFRELIVRLLSVMECSEAAKAECFAPLVETLLRLRTRFRQERRWAEADALRDSMHEVGIMVEDTPEGTRWRTD